MIMDRSTSFPRSLLAATVMALAAVPPAAQAADVTALDWSLRAPTQEHVTFVGAVNFDSAGGPAGAMLYPAPNAAGLLAAIITHGVLAEATKKSEKEKLQQEANKVLQPYQPVLQSYGSRDLMQRALQRMPPGQQLLEGDDSAGTGLTVETVPVFSLTQDQTAIVLDNDITVSGSGLGDARPYRNVVRVVSSVHAVADPSAYWTADQGERLKNESATLLAESLRIALQQATATPQAQAPVFKTIRYEEGSTEKMERGQPLEVRCDRVVLRTLRGWLMSVPRRANDVAADAPCAASAGTGTSSVADAAR